MNKENINNEIYAAISHAIHLEISRNMHDIESYKLTIKQNKNSAWNLKPQLMRRNPR